MRVLDWFRKQAKWIEETEDIMHLQNIVTEGMKKHFTGKHNMLDTDSINMSVYEEYCGYPDGIQLEYDLFNVDLGYEHHIKHVKHIYKFAFKKSFQDFYYRSAIYPCNELILNSVSDKIRGCNTLEDLVKLNILGEIETSKRVKPITTEVLIGVNKKSLLNSIEGIVFVHKFLPKWNDTFAPNNRIFKTYIFPIQFGQRLLMDIASHLDELLEKSYDCGNGLTACSIIGENYWKGEKMWTRFITNGRRNGNNIF